MSNHVHPGGVADTGWLLSVIESNYVQLKILGKLRPGFKLSSTGHYLAIEPESWWQPLRRSWNKDSRAQAVERVADLITQAIDITNVLMHLGHHQNMHLQDYHDALLAACNGIRNLALVYEDDDRVAAQTEGILRKAQHQIQYLSDHIGIVKSTGMEPNAGASFSNKDQG